jgi:tetratricopeptide (TPR) repeat protein
MSEYIGRESAGSAFLKEDKMKKTTKTISLKNLMLVAIATVSLLFAAQLRAEAQQTDEHFEQGLALFRSKDYKKAIKALEQSLKSNPNNPTTFYILGDAYYNTRQYTKAVKAYQETLRLNPNQPSAKQDLADAQTKMKEEKAAREAAWANIANSMKNNRSAPPNPPRRNEDDADEETAAPSRGNAENVTGNRTLPAGAPTEQEVKQAIEKFNREFYDAYNGSKASVSSWDSPIQILAGREDMDNTLDPNGDHMMYPVKVDYTITIEGKRSIRYTGGALGFRKDAFGEWKYYTLEDYQKR